MILLVPLLPHWHYLAIKMTGLHTALGWNLRRPNFFNLDILMQLWNALLAPHGDSAPFRDHRDLYSTIDATLIGGVPWESFNITYNGPKPESNTPA